MQTPVNQEYMSETLEALRQALGGELPAPGTPAFEQALRRIQRDRPELLDALKSLQDPEAIPPPNQVHKTTLKEFAGAARRAKSVEKTQGLLNRWLGIKDPRRNRTHFNYRLTAVIMGLLILLGGMVWAFWPALSQLLAAREQTPPAVETTAPATASATNNLAGGLPVASPPPVEMGAAPPSPEMALPPGTDPAGGVVPTQPGATPPIPMPPAPGAWGTGANAQPVPPPPLPEYAATPAPPPVPPAAAAAGGGTGIVAATAPAPAFNPVTLTRAQQPPAAASVVALQDPATNAGEAGQPGAAPEAANNYVASLVAASNRHTVLEGSRREGRSPVVLQSETRAQAEHTAMRQPTPEGQHLALAPVNQNAGRADNNVGQAPTAPPPTVSAPAGEVRPVIPAPGPMPAPAPVPAPGTANDLLAPMPGTGPLSRPVPPTPAPNLVLAEYPFEIGEIQKGELVSGVVIPEGSTQAALMVRTAEGYHFFGAATLDRAGRLQIQFDRAYKGRRAYVVRAVGLDERGIAGIPANVSEQTPNLLNNLLRGAATGLVSYIDFYTRASTTTILPGGGIATATVPPPLGLTLLAGSARQIAAPPDMTSVVRVWSLEPGTRMQILIVPGDAGGGAR